MPKFLQLQIPTPCHEDWNQMTPEAQGRFCNSCQKAVVDFTQMSDAQLIAFFKKPKQSTCGRFTQEQLEKDILIPPKRIPWAKYFFQITLPAFLLSLKSTAQSIRIKTPVQTISATNKEKMVPVLIGDTTVVEATTLTGFIKDSEGQPIPYASVMIHGTNTGVAADNEGRFIIKAVSLPCTLEVSSVGFVSKQALVSFNQAQVNLQLATTYLQGFSVGGVIAVKSLKRKKNKINIKKETCIKPPPVTPFLTVYPNPVLTSTPLHLKWQHLEAGNYVIEVYNISGTLMQSQKLLLEKGMQATSLSINQLMAGNYFVRMINEKTGKQLSQQFIVQE